MCGRSSVMLGAATSLHLQRKRAQYRWLHSSSVPAEELGLVGNKCSSHNHANVSAEASPPGVAIDKLECHFKCSALGNAPLAGTSTSTTGLSFVAWGYAQAPIQFQDLIQSWSHN